MEADIHTLYSTEFYQILDFKCRCKTCSMSQPEYSNSFSISFVRTGNFLYHVFRNSFDAYTGGILISKPDSEHQVTHLHYSVPDECTIFDFKHDFYNQLRDDYKISNGGFFSNDDFHSIVINATPETEYLHTTVLKKMKEGEKDKLEIDTLVFELVDLVLGSVAVIQPIKKLNEKLKKNHLQTIERAKEYMGDRFADDISLFDIAKYSFVSPYHFSRLFKLFTMVSPHQYVMNLRLKNAELLLKNTSLAITDICFASGFNSAQYFVSAFQQKYGCSPGSFRQSRSAF